MGKKKQPVMQIDPNTGEVVAIYESRLLAAIATDTDVASIRKVARGDRKSAGGYAWKNVSIPKAKRLKVTKGMIAQIDSLTNKIIGLFRDKELASSVTGIPKFAISRTLNGTTKRAGGYAWEVNA